VAAAVPGIVYGNLNIEAHAAVAAAAGQQQDVTAAAAALYLPSSKALFLRPSAKLAFHAAALYSDSFKASSGALKRGRERDGTHGQEQEEEEAEGGGTKRSVRGGGGGDQGLDDMEAEAEAGAEPKIKTETEVVPAPAHVIPPTSTPAQPRQPQQHTEAAARHAAHSELIHEMNLVRDHGYTTYRVNPEVVAAAAAKAEANRIAEQEKKREREREERMRLAAAAALVPLKQSEIRLFPTAAARANANTMLAMAPSNGAPVVMSLPASAPAHVPAVPPAAAASVSGGEDKQSLPFRSSSSAPRSCASVLAVFAVSEYYPDQNIHPPPGAGTAARTGARATAAGAAEEVIGWCAASAVRTRKYLPPHTTHMTVVPAFSAAFRAPSAR
jgi:hypothetical protein